MTRKVVSDRICDTQQAVVVVGKYTYGAEHDVAGQSVQELYRTADGNWFLCSGTSATAFPEGPPGASLVLEITPLVKQEARRWLLLQGEDAVVAEYFPEAFEKH
jgi:hypothetical protein